MIMEQAEVASRDRKEIDVASCDQKEKGNVVSCDQIKKGNVASCDQKWKEYVASYDKIKKGYAASCDQIMKGEVASCDQVLPGEDSGGQYLCSQCPNTFRNSRSLRSHMAGEHCDVEEGTPASSCDEVEEEAEPLEKKPAVIRNQGCPYCSLEIPDRSEMDKDHNLKFYL